MGGTYEPSELQKKIYGIDFPLTVHVRVKRESVSGGHATNFLVFGSVIAPNIPAAEEFAGRTIASFTRRYVLVHPEIDGKVKPRINVMSYNASSNPAWTTLAEEAISTFDINCDQWHNMQNDMSRIEVTRIPPPQPNFPEDPPFT